ncbi:MAG: hypothetical protein QG556_336, partial [Pseudomonadota bacterium]|nr:hypothetical protein [Pseudomonadota bacterium]
MVFDDENKSYLIYNNFLSMMVFFCYNISNFVFFFGSYMQSLADYIVQQLIKNNLTSDQKIQKIEHIFRISHDVQYHNGQYFALDVELTADDVIVREISAVNLRRSNGNTLLFLAAKDRDYVLLDWLISNGADINQRNFKQQCILHEAIEHGQFEIFEYLFKRGAIRLYEHHKYARLKLQELESQVEPNISVYHGVQNILQHFERFPLNYAAFMRYHLQQRDPDTIWLTKMYMWR